ncbi:MAG: ABC transporter ATP-binding protein [Planctomycetia bacterium]|nr:ABC transporter ATP-binding protein [Planctomycetia bacterium]
MSQALLTVDSLGVEFKTDDGIVRAVDDVSFSIAPGETLGIAGESGSGKSVTNLALMGLIPKPPGKIVAGQALFQGADLLTMPAERLRKIRGRRIAMIFQDPMTSLNPLLTVAEQLTEMTRLHLGHTPRQALDHAVAMLDRVGIPGASKRVLEYPHQFSGGMRQRVMIAMALSCNPDLLIADEPTTALDVTIQAQILELLRELQRDQGMAIIFITHDLGVMANICRRVVVMYGGRIVEEAPVDELFARPRHPYTLGLLRSRPRLDSPRGERLEPIPGQPPDLTRLPSGCAFHPRCKFAADICRTQRPELRPSPTDGRFACHFDILPLVDAPQGALLHG